MTSSRLDAYIVDLNKSMRKYGFDGTARRTHFLAQTYIETAIT
jgi:predicted chitinase